MLKVLVWRLQNQKRLTVDFVEKLPNAKAKPNPEMAGDLPGCL
jgi:hypothetical protein